MIDLRQPIGQRYPPPIALLDHPLWPGSNVGPFFAVVNKGGLGSVVGSYQPPSIGGTPTLSKSSAKECDLRFVHHCNTYSGVAKARRKRGLFRTLMLASVRLPQIVKTIVATYGPQRAAESVKHVGVNTAPAKVRSYG